MKTLLFLLLISNSSFAYTISIDNPFLGTWKPVKEMGKSVKLEEVTFFGDGSMNIKTAETLMLFRYNFRKKDGKYAAVAELGDPENRVFIDLIDRDKIRVTAPKQSFVMKKYKDLKTGIIPVAQKPVR